MSAVLANTTRRLPGARELQGIQPNEQIGIAFPSWWLALSQSRINLLQRFPLGLDVCLSVKVRRIEMGMAHPTPDDCDIDARPQPGELQSCA